MKKITVCQVLNQYQVGGAETVALDLARSLDPGRFESLALAAVEPPAPEPAPMRRRFEAAGVPAHALVGRRLGDPRTLWALLRFFRRHRPDIVHAHNRPADHWALRCALWAGVPAVTWTRHLVYEDMTPRQCRRYRALADRTPVVVAVSDEVRRHCLEVEGIPADRIRTVVNGIDTRRFRPAGADERRATREALGLAPDELALLFVGRLTAQKAPEVFVDLVHRLRGDGLPVRGFLCGRGERSAELQERCARAEGAVLLGVRQDVPALLGACDIFVSTSRNEGLPLNVMEAMAAGAAFVAPELPQVRQLVASEPELRAGLLPRPPAGEVPAALVRRWSQAVADLLADPAARRRRGASARRVIEAGFSLERMVREHEAIYAELLAATR